MLSLRCSKLPLVMACPAAAVDDGMRVEPSDDSAARLGTAVHHVLTSAVKGQAVEVSDACKLYGVEDVEEAERLTHWSWRAWDSVKGWFPDPQAELPLEKIDNENGLHLTGHLDIFSDCETVVRVTDLKTGRADGNHLDQIRGYCLLALEYYPGAERAYGVVIHARHQLCDGRYFERQELQDWYARLVETVKRSDVFRPGPHCSHCPRAAACPAKTALITQAWQALDLFDSTDGLPADPVLRGSVLLKIHQKAKLVQDAAAMALELIKADVAAHGGSLPTAEGGELRLVEQSHRQIDLGLAWPTLVAAYGQDAVVGAARIAKGAAEDLARVGAARGQKWAAVQELMALLDAEGAVTSKPVVRLEVRRAVEQQQSELTICEGT